MKLICISGKKRSGKDTIAKYISDQYGYDVIALAEPIKQALINTEVGDYFDMDTLNGFGVIDRETPFFTNKDFIETVLIDAIMYCDSILPFSEISVLMNKIRKITETLDFQSGISIRRLMTLLGTDLVSSSFPLYWCQFALMQATKRNLTKIVISDVRLKTEQEFFEVFNSKFIFVERETHLVDEHVTERGLYPNRSYADYCVVDNNSSLHKTYKQIDDYLK